MARSYASRVVPAAADEAWALVRDFGGLPGWHPAIGSGELESGASPTELGAVRRLVVGDGGVVRERLVGLDDTARSCTYEITEGPFPVRSYRSTIRVLPITATGDSFVEWYADYDAEAADEAKLDEIFGGGVFGPGLKALADHYAS